jgi:hypothetical protein
MQRAALLTIALLATTAPCAQELKRGQYLVTIMDCSGCHTPGVFQGNPDTQRPLAGSEVGFKIPGLGYFYPPNLTPDPETGLGKWSNAESSGGLSEEPEAHSQSGACCDRRYGESTRTLFDRSSALAQVAVGLRPAA